MAENVLKELGPKNRSKQTIQIDLKRTSKGINIFNIDQNGFSYTSI